MDFGRLSVLLFEASRIVTEPCEEIHPQLAVKFSDAAADLVRDPVNACLREG